MNKLIQLWGALRLSFWFMPSLMVAGSIAFTVVVIEADSAASDRWLSQWPRLNGVGAENARTAGNSVWVLRRRSEGIELWIRI